MEIKNENSAEIKEMWIKPELIVMSITENTLGFRGLDPDFGFFVSS